ncbi:TMS membrane protein [Pelomyxa schiedti]|nr:TMS membrane protein [Pelomyxa schiedti]
MGRSSWLIGFCSCTTCRCCVGFSFSLCGKRIPVNVSALIYVITFLSVSSLAWALSSYAPTSALSNFSPEFSKCASDDRSCLRTLLVDRMLFSLALYHAIHAILLVRVRTTADWRNQIQIGWWFVKIFILVLCIIISLFIPNEFFMGYDWIAMLGASLFILLQIVILIDSACSWGAQWVKNMDETDNNPYRSHYCNKWKTLLLIFTFGLYTFSLVLTVLLYVYFTNDYIPGECSGSPYNITFITLNIVFSIVVAAISVAPKVREKKPDSGLMQSSVVTAYTTFLVLSSISSEPYSWMEGCNKWTTDSNGSSKAATVTLILGAILTILTVVYTTTSTSYGLTSWERIAAYSVINTSDHEEPEDSLAITTNVAYNYCIFHIVFALGAMYVGQLLTNWQVLTKDDSSMMVDSGVAAVWIKMTSGWLVICLYIWTLVSPVLFPDKDFTALFCCLQL